MGKDELVWGNLIHLSRNMWEDYTGPECADRGYKPHLQFDEGLWNDILNEMARIGMTMVVLDLGDAVRYESHPEIAVEGAWSTGRLKEELNKVRSLGMEPVPKLNFSTTHDAWLGPYSRCVSTETYYAVCRDLIEEVVEIFDQPRFFHLGMDEEGMACQRRYKYVVIRQFDLWWHDLLFYVKQVEAAGSRPWVWSDAFWHKGNEYLENMPRSVVQSNWYYGVEFDESIDSVKTYLDLDAHGYEQIPTGSNWQDPASFRLTVQYCRQHLDSSRLLGFLQTTWKATLEENRERHMAAIKQVEEAMAAIS